MRLLLVTRDFPLPVDAGGVVRLLGLAEALRTRHDVHLVSRERGPTPPALVDALRARLDAPVETFPVPERTIARSAPAKAARWATALRTGEPPWIPEHRSAPMAARLRELSPDFDAAVILDDMAATYAEDLAPLVPAVLDKQNVWGASFAAGARGPAGAVVLRTVRAYERRTSELAAAVVVTSEREGDRFAEVYGWRPDVVPSAIPTPEPLAASADAPPHVAWLGDLTYAPNADGLVRFAEEAWAPLGEQGARLRVIGRSPSPEVERLGRLPGVDVLGFVPRLEDELRGCAAAVVPLWAGVGIKMKTLTFLGAGLPTAATPVAMEGIAARDGEAVRIADDPAALADALRALLDDRGGAAALGARGREVVLADHVWPVVLDRYEAILARAALGRG